MSRPPRDDESYGGRFVVSWQDGAPRVADARGGVLLDLAGTGYAGDVVLSDGPLLRLALTGPGGRGDVELDLDARTFRVAERHGSLAVVCTALAAAGLADAGAIEPVALDERFRVEWRVESEEHGALWDQPRLVDQRTGRVLVDLHGHAAYGLSGSVVRAAGATVELLVVDVLRGDRCTVRVDADAGTYAIHGIRLTRAGADRLRGLLRATGLAGAAE